MIIGANNKPLTGLIYRHKKELAEKIDQAKRRGKLAYSYELINNGLFLIFKDNAILINPKTKRDTKKCLIIDNHHVSSFSNIKQALERHDVLIKPMANMSKDKEKQMSVLKKIISDARKNFMGKYNKNYKLNVVFTYNFINENYESKFNQLDFKIYKK